VTIAILLDFEAGIKKEEIKRQKAKGKGKNIKFHIFGFRLLPFAF
jgi:hypothetical protein